ncbi:zinc finger zz domain containing 3 [Holotrichia oblita]|uniref:Zinc finger zz domain containing 3 n=1 Tax=Holotrichia oblita TaxID=644536 RepID=A0ACB9TWZ4_HOLOL|nr:zinc finger zz domain containing 3 [Holotrichia oblita]
MTDESFKNEEDDLFYFESDHLALKGNIEYSDLMKTLFVLEAQRRRAIDDYNKVIQLQKEFEKDPMLLVKKLKTGESLGIPDMQHIIDVPKITWSKFNVTVPEQVITEINKDDEDTIARLKSDDLKQKNSSNTRSKPWTVEEQKRLQELLIEYPPEAIELRRFKKIAAALGTRTVKQVCSRVQKYFLKLRQAGLPIPGRIPKMFERKRSHKHQRLNHLLFKPSTFFPHLDIPVVMNDDDEVPGPSQTSKLSESTHDCYSSNYLLTSSYHEDRKLLTGRTEMDLQLYLLRSIRNEKQIENNESVTLFQHVGFKCDYCDEEPISGSRWHCATCDPKSIDFCTDCMLSQMYTDNKHPLTHKFLIIRDDKTIISTDSSSESISGSMEVEDSNKDLGSSELDSDDFEDYVNEELSMSVSQENEMEEERAIKTEYTDTSIHYENNHDYYIKQEDTSEEQEQIYNSQVDNIAYNYLHSNLFLDET